MYANPDMAKAMRYRADYHPGSEDEQPEKTEEPERMYFFFFFFFVGEGREMRHAP